MKRKSLFLLLLCFAGILHVGAQQVSMRDVFSHMPDSLLPYLSQNNRLDLIDFAESEMAAEITNTFDERVKLSKLTSDYLKLELSKASLVEMRLLPSTELLSDTAKTIVCLVTSFGETTPFSTITFYTSKWTPLPLEDPITANKDKLIVRPDTMSIETFNDLKDAFLPLYVSASLSETGNTLVLKASPQSRIHADDAEKPINDIIKPVSIEWDGMAFR